MNLLTKYLDELTVKSRPLNADRLLIGQYPLFLPLYKMWPALHGDGGCRRRNSKLLNLRFNFLLFDHCQEDGRQVLSVHCFKGLFTSCSTPAFFSMTLMPSPPQNEGESYASKTRFHKKPLRENEKIF